MMMDDDVEHADVQDDGRLMLLRMVYTENLRANTGLTSGILDSVIFGLLRTAQCMSEGPGCYVDNGCIPSHFVRKPDRTAISVGAAKRLGPT